MAAELKDLHLADLHQRAAAAGVTGYRKLGRDELIEAIAEAPDADPDAPGRTRASSGHRSPSAPSEEATGG
jgi:hypothetical protein